MTVGQFIHGLAQTLLLALLTGICLFMLGMVASVVCDAFMAGWNLFRKKDG